MASRTGISGFRQTMYGVRLYCSHATVIGIARIGSSSNPIPTLTNSDNGDCQSAGTSTGGLLNQVRQMMMQTTVNGSNPHNPMTAAGRTTAHNECKYLKNGIKGVWNDTGFPCANCKKNNAKPM